MRRGKAISDRSRPVSVAITGGMGAGKSAVSQFLATRLACRLLSADLICRTLLNPGEEAWYAFVELFGKRYVDSDGNILRSLLRRHIFENADLRQGLEAILHPLARKEIQKQTTSCNNSGKSVLVEVPLLFEVGWQDDFDEVIVVYAVEEVCLARICQRDGVTAAEARKEFSSQIPVIKKVMSADHVVDNSGCWAATLLQLIHLCEILSELTGFGGKNT